MTRDFVFLRPLGLRLGTAGLRRRSEPGTLIRNATIQLERSGERREIGRNRKVSFPAAKALALRSVAGVNPVRGVTTREAAGNVRSGTKIRAGCIDPDSGGFESVTGGGALGGTVFVTGGAGQESGRPGTLIWQWWSGDGQSLSGRERPLLPAGSGKGRRAGAPESADPA